MSLSERVRPNVECAPWVIGEIVALEEENGVLRQRIEALRAAMHRVVADTLAAEPKLCIAEKPRGCATPGACNALTQIDDLGMRIEPLVWATVLRLNKALAADDDNEN